MSYNYLNLDLPIYLFSELLWYLSVCNLIHLSSVTGIACPDDDVCRSTYDIWKINVTAFWQRFRELCIVCWLCFHFDHFLLPLLPFSPWLVFVLYWPIAGLWLLFPSISHCPYFRIVVHYFMSHKWIVRLQILEYCVCVFYCCCGSIFACVCAWPLTLVCCGAAAALPDWR